MELDDLKVTWRLAVDGEKTQEELLKIIKKGSGPTLRKIKLQALIEIIGWIIFLFICFTVLDGSTRGIMEQTIVVAAFALAILVNILLYRRAHYPINNDALSVAVSRFVRDTKWLAAISLLARIVLASALLLFLTNGIIVTSDKYEAWGMIILIFTVQIVFYVLLWVGRLSTLKKTMLFFK